MSTESALLTLVVLAAIAMGASIPLLAMVFVTVKNLSSFLVRAKEVLDRTGPEVELTLQSTRSIVKNAELASELFEPAALDLKKTVAGVATLSGWVSASARRIELASLVGAAGAQILGGVLGHRKAAKEEAEAEEAELEAAELGSGGVRLEDSAVGPNHAANGRDFERRLES